MNHLVIILGMKGIYYEGNLMFLGKSRNLQFKNKVRFNKPIL